MKKQWKTWETESDEKLENNKKDYLKCTTKPSYILHKIFDNNIVAIQKSEVALRLNKRPYIGIVYQFQCMDEFHYDCIKNKYDSKSKLLISDTDSLMYEIKSEGVNEDFSSNKEMFDLLLFD